MFITFEGLDGSGKSTQSTLLCEFLTGLGHNVLFSREPGGTEISEHIRRILHDKDNKEMGPRAETLLYASTRAQLVGEKIRPHLTAGGIAVSDRYTDSTLAYQGYGRGLDLETLRLITSFATNRLSPDLTLLLDLDPEVGLRRRRTNGVEWNRMNDLELGFYQRVRQGYLELARSEPERWVVLDAATDVKSLQRQVQQEAEQRLRVKS